MNRIKSNKIIISIILILIVVIILNVKPIGKKLYPIKYIDYITKYSSEYNLDPFLVASIIYVESKYKENAVSPKGAVGLMQILPSTGRWAAEEIGIINYSDEMLYDYKTNIQIGCWYLSRLNKQFDDLDVVLAAYNGGSGNVSKWLRNPEYSEDNFTLYKIPFKETDDYVKKVKMNHKIYKYLYL